MVRRADGRRGRAGVPLSTNKAAAQAMMADLVRKVERERAGAADPFEAHRRRPLGEHLAEWEAALRASGATDKHVRQTVACVRKVIDGSKLTFPADLTASRVQQFLADLRRDEAAPDLDPGKEWYTRTEVAALLGVTPFAVPKLVAHHALAATGNGKARRYPLETAAALVERKVRGRGAGTANMYLVGVKAFARWLVTARRVPDNPLAHTKRADVGGDRRLRRRVLSADDLRRVVSAARESQKAVRGL